MSKKLKAIPQEDRDQLRQALNHYRGQVLTVSGEQVTTVELVLTLLETYEGILGLIAWLEGGTP